MAGDFMSDSHDDVTVPITILMVPVVRVQALQTCIIPLCEGAKNVPIYPEKAPPAEILDPLWISKLVL